MRPGDSEHLTVTPDGRFEHEHPRWRRDFPIDSVQERYISRRDFTKFMVLTSFAFVAGQFWILVQNFFRSRKGAPPIQKIAAINDIPVGGFVTFSYPKGEKHCVLVRLSKASFVAYDQQCTHLACPVIPQPENDRLYCPCHEGFFDLETGRPLAGPPRRPLPRIILELRGNAIYATGMQEG